MLIRKNHSRTNLHLSKFNLSTPSQQQNLIESRFSQHQLDVKSLNTEQLVTKIQEQQAQIQKLVTIIHKYKGNFALLSLEKIAEFEQYEDIIKDFLAQKQRQNRKQQILPKNVRPFETSSGFFQDIDVSTQSNKRNRKPFITAAYSMTVLCEKQKIKQKNQNIEISKQSLAYLLDSKYKKQEHKQNRPVWSSSGQQFLKSFVLKENKSLLNQTVFKESNQVKCLKNQGGFKQDAQKIGIGRVPSLSNLRRIQNCMKLLKS